MKLARKDLKLKHLWVIYPGEKNYLLDEGIECVGISQLSRILQRF